MTKKEYQKPAMEVVDIDMKAQILAGSVDQYNMNRSLQDEEVDDGW